MARPLQATYSKTRPYVVERHDEEDGSINYEIWDHRPESYRRLCTISEGPIEDDDDEPTDRGQAKKDAELIARALNLPDSAAVARAFEEAAKIAESHQMSGFGYPDPRTQRAIAAAIRARAQEMRTVRAIQVWWGAKIRELADGESSAPPPGQR